MIDEKIRRTNRVLYATIIIILIGFLDALYLLYMELTNQFYCPINIGKFQCVDVNTSNYAIFLGVHLSVWGVIYYLVMMLISILAVRTKTEKNYWISFFLPFGAIWGAGFSIYLTILEAFFIGAYCEFCVLSAICSFIIFILVVLAKIIFNGSLFRDLNFWNILKKEV